MTFFSIPTISMAWSGSIVIGWFKLDEFIQTLSSPIPSSTRLIFSVGAGYTATHLHGPFPDLSSMVDF
jgi:hypothetical protein